MLANNLNKLRELPPEGRGQLLQAVVLLPFLHLGLLLLGYSRLRRLLETLAPLKLIQETFPETEHIQRGREIARIVTIAAVHGPYRATCLRRSLLVWWFLRREGIPGKVCFGARLSERSLEAHAWVEYNGIIINDYADVRAQYKPLYGALRANEPGL